jgi:hypothetical protein
VSFAGSGPSVRHSPTSTPIPYSVRRTRTASL